MTSYADIERMLGLQEEPKQEGGVASYEDLARAAETGKAADAFQTNPMQSSQQAVEERLKGLIKKHGAENVEILRFTSGLPYKIRYFEKKPWPGKEGETYPVIRDITLEDFVTEHQKRVQESAVRTGESPLTIAERGLASLNLTDAGKIKTLRKQLGDNNVEPIVDQRGNLKEILVRRKEDEQWKTAEPDLSMIDIAKKVGVAMLAAPLGLPAALVTGNIAVEGARETAGDIAELAGDVLEYAPGVAGSVLGSLLGGVKGALAGAAIGDVAGPAVRQKVSEALGGEKELSAQELAIRGGINAALGLATEGAVRVVGGVGKRVLQGAPLEKLGSRVAQDIVLEGGVEKPASEVAESTLKSAKLFGIESMTPGGATRGLSGEAREFDRLIQGLPGAERGRGHARRVLLLAENVDAKIDEMLGKKKLSEEATMKALAATYNKMRRANIQTLLNAGDEAFSAARARAGGRRVASANNFLSELESMIERFGSPGSPNSAALEGLQKIADTVRRDSAQAVSSSRKAAARRAARERLGLKQGQSPPEGFNKAFEEAWAKISIKTLAERGKVNWTVDQLQNALKDWREAASRGGAEIKDVGVDTRKQIARRLYSALQKDLAATSERGYPELQKARQMYAASIAAEQRSRITALDRIISKGLRKGAPPVGTRGFSVEDLQDGAKVADALVKESPENIRKILTMADAVAPGTSRLYKRLVIERLLAKAEPSAADTLLTGAGATLDPTKLAGVIKKNKAAMTTILGRRGGMFFHHLERVAQALAAERVGVEMAKEPGTSLAQKLFGGLHMVRGRRGRTTPLFVLRAKTLADAANQILSDPQKQAEIATDPAKLRLFMGLTNKRRRISPASVIRTLGQLGLVEDIENLKEPQ